MNESAVLIVWTPDMLELFLFFQVKCSHELCRNVQVPALDFSEVCETAFQTGPPNLQKYFRAVRIIINTFLCITQVGFCYVYFFFISANVVEVF